LKEKGLTVTGSDQNVYPPMSTFLAARQIEVMNGYRERNLAHKPDLVVIGKAISRGNPEAEYALDHKLWFCSLPELLREFFIRGKRCLVVAGTHGKTTKQFEVGTEMFCRMNAWMPTTAERDKRVAFQSGSRRSEF
jgi:UDP-N-acetylmuramate: L-alanyl-gamma-D-glutamyl-meso-diaminopimelate ligase